MSQHFSRLNQNDKFNTCLTNCLPFIKHYITFVCQCRYGFIGDGHTCEPAPIYEGNDVIVSIGYALLKLNLDSKIGM